MELQRVKLKCEGPAAVTYDPTKFASEWFERNYEILRVAPRRKLFLDAHGIVNHADGCTLHRNIKLDKIRHGHLLFAVNHHDHADESAR